MRVIALALLIVFVAWVSYGCNSGTMKGIGSDVERLGNKMQS